MHKVIILSAVAGALALAACQNGGASGSSTTANPTPAPNAAAPNPPVNPNLTGATINVDPIINAANRDRIQQSPDDVRLNPPKEAKLITGFAAQVREAPSGDVLSMAETEANVTEVARDRAGTHYLVLYPDPKDARRQLAGWVNKDALENTEWSSTARVNAAENKMTCPTGESHVRTTTDFCAKTCRTDHDCDKASGLICDGLAFEVAKDGKLSNASYCVPAKGGTRSETATPVR
jgi:hypothetical protein